MHCMCGISITFILVNMSYTHTLSPTFKKTLACFFSPRAIMKRNLFNLAWHHLINSTCKARSTKQSPIKEIHELIRKFKTQTTFLINEKHLNFKYINYIYIYNFVNALLYNSMRVLSILRKNSEELLNKCSKVMLRCPHERKYLLSNYDSKDWLIA